MTHTPEHLDPAVYAGFFAANQEAIAALEARDSERWKLPRGTLPIEYLYRHIVGRDDRLYNEDTLASNGVSSTAIGHVAFSQQLYAPRVLGRHNIMLLAPLIPDLHNEEYPLLPFPIPERIGIGQSALSRLLIVPFEAAQQEVRDSRQYGDGPGAIFNPR